MLDQRDTPLFSLEHYLHHFSFVTEPFGLTSDPALHFLSASHEKALAAMEAVLLARSGLILLTGDVGTGKTTLANVARRRWRCAHAVALVETGSFTFADISRRALSEYRPADPGEFEDSDPSLADFLEEARSEGETVALIVDEAQNLTPDAAEQIARLLERETDCQNLIQVVLVGQPALAKRLRRGDLRSLGKHIATHSRLAPLSAAESRTYIQHRVAAVGGDPQTFEPAAMRVIAREARGLPRRLNVLCHHSLGIAFSTDAKRVDEATARRAIRYSHGEYESPARRRPSPGLRAAGMLAAGALLFTVGAIGVQWRQREVAPALESHSESPPPARIATRELAPPAESARSDDSLIAALPDAAPLFGESSTEARGEPVRVLSATLAESVEGREPRGPGDHFPADVGNLAFWNRLSAASGSQVEHVWYFEGQEVLRVPLEVGGDNWRLWSSKTIYPGQVGEWEVAVIDAQGTAVESLGFRVEPPVAH